MYLTERGDGQDLCMPTSALGFGVDKARLRSCRQLSPMSKASRMLRIQDLDSLARLTNSTLSPLHGEQILRSC